MVRFARLSSCVLALALGACDDEPPPPPKQRTAPKAHAAGPAKAAAPAVADPGPPPEPEDAGPPNLLEFVQRDDGTCVLEERCADGTDTCERLPPRKVDCPEGKGSPLRDAEGLPLEVKVLPKGELVDETRSVAGEPPAKPLNEEPRSTTRPKKPPKSGRGKCMRQPPPPCEGCEAPPPEVIDCNELGGAP